VTAALVCRLESRLPAAASRTQEERTLSTRRRLVEATIAAIDEEGFAGASVSRIVERAGVSRGGHLHHFASKDLILAAVGDHLSASVFRRTGAVLKACPDPEARLGALLRFLWRDVMSQREGRVLNELMVAARTDPVLASHLRPMVLRAIRLYGRAAERLFIARPGAALDVQTAFRMAQWCLRGMMMDQPISQDRSFFESQLEALILALSPVIVGRPE
jgi:AcrR family transcriptional regulator